MSDAYTTIRHQRHGNIGTLTLPGKRNAHVAAQASLKSES